MMSKKFFFAYSFFMMTIMVSMGQVKEEAFFHRTPDPIKSVEIFPNPATEFVNVKFTTPIANTIKLSLHNVIGNTMELETEILDEHVIKIRVKDLATGYYLITVKDERLNISNTYKFIKR